MPLGFEDLCCCGVSRAVGSFAMGAFSGPALPLGFGDLFFCGGGKAVGSFEVAEGSKPTLPLGFGDLFLCGVRRAVGSFEVAEGSKPALPLEQIHLQRISVRKWLRSHCRLGRPARGEERRRRRSPSRTLLGGIEFQTEATTATSVGNSFKHFYTRLRIDLKLAMHSNYLEQG